jgi:hypothetical protein
LGSVLNDLEFSGLLDPDDLLVIRSIFARYTGASSTVTGSLGIARAGDVAADQGRRAAATVRANVENNQAVARGYKEFWDKNLAAHSASIRR